MSDGAKEHHNGHKFEKLARRAVISGLRENVGISKIPHQGAKQGLYILISYRRDQSMNLMKWEYFWPFTKKK